MLPDGSVKQDQGTSPKRSLATFSEVTEEETRKAINSMAAKPCSKDPIPTWLLKASVAELLPVITEILNSSLSSGTFPSQLKSALVTPLLTKPSLDPNTLKNYTPISNLSFLSKVLEKAVFNQLTTYTSDNLFEPMQSAYRGYYSTETALVRVQNNILRPLDDHNAVVLVLLVLSAAFDTVNHPILVSRLEHRLGLSDTALQCFCSYLSGRQQSVLVRKISEVRSLDCGVPLGGLCLAL